MGIYRRVVGVDVPVQGARVELGVVDVEFTRVGDGARGFERGGVHRARRRRASSRLRDGDRHVVVELVKRSKRNRGVGVEKFPLARARDVRQRGPGVA